MENKEKLSSENLLLPYFRYYSLIIAILMLIIGLLSQISIIILFGLLALCYNLFQRPSVWSTIAKVVILDYDNSQIVLFTNRKKIEKHFKEFFDAKSDFWGTTICIQFIDGSKFYFYPKRNVFRNNKPILSLLKRLKV